MHIAHIGNVTLSDVLINVAVYVMRNMNRNITMTPISKITINNEVVDVVAIEAKAHQMRAEAMAEFGRALRTWVKNLFGGLSSRAAH